MSFNWKDLRKRGTNKMSELEDAFKHETVESAAELDKIFKEIEDTAGEQDERIIELENSIKKLEKEIDEQDDQISFAVAVLARNLKVPEEEVYKWVRTSTYHSSFHNKLGHMERFLEGIKHDEEKGS